MRHREVRAAWGAREMKMRAMTWRRLTGALGAGIVSIPLFLAAGAQLGVRVHRPALPAGAAGRGAPPAPRDDFERRMRGGERRHFPAWRGGSPAGGAPGGWGRAARGPLGPGGRRGEG